MDGVKGRRGYFWLGIVGGGGFLGLVWHGTGVLFMLSD